MKTHEPLSGVDAAWLRMDDPTNLMTITGVLVLDDPMDLATLKAVLDERLLGFTRFRQRVRDPDDDPQWELDPNFDLDQHVRRSALPGEGDRAELKQRVSELMSDPLPRTNRTRRPVPGISCEVDEFLNPGDFILGEDTLVEEGRDAAVECACLYGLLVLPVRREISVDRPFIWGKRLPPLEEVGKFLPLISRHTALQDVMETGFGPGGLTGRGGGRCLALGIRLVELSLGFIPVVAGPPA